MAKRAKREKTNQPNHTENWRSIYSDKLSDGRQLANIVTLNSKPHLLIVKDGDNETIVTTTELLVKLPVYKPFTPSLLASLGPRYIHHATIKPWVYHSIMEIGELTVAITLNRVVSYEELLDQWLFADGSKCGYVINE